MKDFLENIGMFLLLIFVCFITVFFIIVVITPLDYIACKNGANVVGREYKYQFLNGCFYKTDKGNFVASDKFLAYTE